MGMSKIENIKIHGRSLKDILVSHKLFLITGGKDGECANLRGADLRGADLRGADLRGADLRETNLRDADLIGAELEDANLGYAKLIEANLRGADLRKTNLRDADLKEANLEQSDLRYINLYNADLRFTNLYKANLIGANLYNAKLVGAKLENIIHDHTTLFYEIQCPEEGSFIGYKKARKCKVELKILEDSKRSSATTRKCRCNKALVLNIENIETGKKVLEVSSDRDENFIYRVGEVVSVDNFNEDRWVECTTGIHFFMTSHEAETYIK